MSTDYSSLITAIETQIATGIDQPGEVSSLAGTVKYRSLTELQKVLENLKKQSTTTSTVRSFFKLARFRPGSAQG